MGRKRNSNAAHSAVAEGSNAFYCPYTDEMIQLIDIDQWSWDHIVPLFMGGDDNFQIRTSRKANNEIGSKIEAPMKNDPLLSPALRNSGIIGRSGAITIPEWKNCVVDGRKTHVKLAQDQWTFWDKIDRRYLDIGGRDVVPIQTQINFNIYAPLRLSAKIALGALVYVFGESIRHDCELNAFRIMMNMQSLDDLKEIQSKKFRIMQRHDAEAWDVGSEGFNWKVMVEAFDRTCLIITPYEGAFGVHVAIAGQHQASFQFDANTVKVPRGGMFDLAHVIMLGPGKMKRCSLRSVHGQIMARVSKLKADAERMMEAKR